MSDNKRSLDENEEIFSEYFTIVEKTKKIKSRPDIDQRALLIEYMQLSENFEKLLKTAVRISKLGDKAQKKLMKYKEIMDALRDIS